MEASLLENKKLRITDIVNDASLCVFVREAWGARAFRKLEIVRFTGGWQLFPELYENLADVLRREFATDWSNALTLAKLGRLYMKNALKNLPLLGQFSSIGDLSFGDAPVLVCGAGPSLDDTLDALDCTEKRNFKIICVDTSLGALLERGISPDLVVILESQHWNLRDFVGCKDRDIPFALDLSALHASAFMLKGRGYFFMTPWTNLRIFERLKKEELLPSVVQPLGSVGLTAVELARRLTRGKISYAGLDFSFTLDKYHARGTPGHRKMLDNHNRFGRLYNKAAFSEQAFDFVNKEGKTVRCNPALRHYRDIFEREFGGDTVKGPVGEEFTRGHGGTGEEIREFIRGERERLTELRGILTGEKEGSGEILEKLIKECDYLWGHFADLAGGRTAPLAEEGEAKDSFLKRVRMEIDPALALLERV
jgi:hypothetical protein